MKYGSFKVYVDDVFIMTIRCSYGDVLDIVWPIHLENPSSNIEICADCD